MFLPTTMKEVNTLGWKSLDVILVTGDSYIDSPFMGISIIGKVLVDKGFRVGIIAQPDMESKNDISRLGEPGLFWGITGGSVDSMVANYTASKKRRKSDDFTPGGINNRRPDRAVISYTNLIRQYFKGTAPIVIGGIEASLRRIAHYDFWSNKIRRSILFDAKGNYLLFGMAHDSVIEFANALKNDTPIEDIRGVAYIAKGPRGLELPSFESVQKDKNEYIKSFDIFYGNTDPITAEPICQKHNDRYLILNPPAQYSTTKQLDHIHDLDFERDLHPYYQKGGTVKALETIKFSIPIHYGCYGECHFCAISVHQGRTVRYRSGASILKEAKKITQLPDFKGYITDLGGPTANMYGFECKKKLKKGACGDKRCLFPKVCKTLNPDHAAYTRLIDKIEQLSGIKKVFISSGIRYDLILNDKHNGLAFLKKIVADNVSGQMKIAPEHTQSDVLTLMGKQDIKQLLDFKQRFDQLSRQSNKKQFLTYYLIAAHPGCNRNDMAALKQFATQQLKTSPEQVQIFTPSPSTYSTLMYYTEMDPFTQKKIFVEKNPREKEKQKQIITQKGKPSYKVALKNKKNSTKSFRKKR